MFSFGTGFLKNQKFFFFREKRHEPLSCWGAWLWTRGIKTVLSAGYRTRQYFAGLGFQINAANSLPAPHWLGISSPSLPTAATAKRRRSSRDLRTRAGGPGPCRDEALRAGGKLRRGGRRRRKAGGGVEEPGPGSLPAYCTRKWRFRWVPERKKQSLFFFFFPPPSSLPPPSANNRSTFPCGALRAWLRRWASTFSFFLLLFSARLLFFF